MSPKTDHLYVFYKLIASFFILLLCSVLVVELLLCFFKSNTTASHQQLEAILKHLEIDQKLGPVDKN